MWDERYIRARATRLAALACAPARHRLVALGSYFWVYYLDYGLTALLFNPPSHIFDAPYRHAWRKFQRRRKRAGFDKPPQVGLGERNEGQDLRLPQEACFGEASKIC